MRLGRKVKEFRAGLCNRDFFIGHGLHFTKYVVAVVRMKGQSYGHQLREFEAAREHAL